ncbi:MAG: hypothetical protein CV089_01790 [Nitrospira sp. WS110]|nr:hypothetical protein [Nitrospira sp. WS110]
MRQACPFAFPWASWRSGIVIGLACGCLEALVVGQVANLQAQTTSITSSGLHTAISSSGTTTFIEGGTRPGGGPHLFHSFGELNVGTGDTAQFVNGVSFDGAGHPLTAGLPTSNIFGRVTGNSLSSIFGTIDSATNFPTANLWLINPNGFLFGPTAALNVGGSVNISTADYLKMTDGTKFNARPGPADSLLSMAPVEAFGFLERTTQSPVFGTITVRGSELAVPTSKSLTMVGGDIGITGQLNQVTQSARGLLFAPSGQIQLASVASKGEVVIGTTASGLPDLKVDSFSQLGNISLSEQAILDTSLDPFDSSGNPGGMVQIRAGSLTMDRSIIASNTVVGNISGAPAVVDLNVAGRTLLQNDSTIDVSGNPGGTVQIRAGSLTMDRSIIASSTLGNISGAPTAVDLNVAGHTLLQNGSTIHTETEGAGKAGDVRVNTGQLTLVNGARIGSSSLSDATGDSGNINISVIDLFSSRGSVVGSEGGEGAGGNVSINAGTIQLAEDTAIFTSSAGFKDAGDVRLTSGRDMLSTDSIVVATAFQASGGNIEVTAPRIIGIFRSGVMTSVRSAPSFSGGNIRIDPIALIILDSAISTHTPPGGGGSISLIATGTLITNPNSIVASSGNTSGFYKNSGLEVLGGVPQAQYRQVDFSGDRCAADPQGQFSSFVQTGRDGVPQIPGGYAPSPLLSLNRLVSNVPGAPSPRLTAARLGLINMGVDSSSLFRFGSACRS